jgi:hypothetical protein
MLKFFQTGENGLKFKKNYLFRFLLVIKKQEVIFAKFDEKMYFCNSISLSEIFMKRIFYFLTFSALVFASCGKKAEEKQVEQEVNLKTVEVKLNDDAPIYMLQTLTISGFSINDTVNGIKARVLTPVKKIKEETRSFKPINSRSEQMFKQSVEQLKQIGKKQEPHQLLVRTVSVVSYNNLVSALMEREIIYAETNQKDSLFFGVTYNVEKNTPLKITEVININEKTFEKISSYFTNVEASLGFNDFVGSEFAISNDSIFVYPTKQEKQYQVAIPIQTIEHYIINDK